MVGLTCRHDVVEMLEKRVKSRFRWAGTHFERASQAFPLLQRHRTRLLPTCQHLDRGGPLAWALPPCSHRKLDLSLPTSVLPVAAREDGETGKRQEAQDGALEVLKARAGPVCVPGGLLVTHAASLFCRRRMTCYW